MPSKKFPVSSRNRFFPRRCNQLCFRHLYGIIVLMGFMYCTPSVLYAQTSDSLDSNDALPEDEGTDIRGTDILPDVAKDDAPDNNGEATFAAVDTTESKVTSGTGKERWFITRNGNSAGPFTGDQIAGLIRTRKITRYTMVLKENTTNWVQARTVFDFQAVPAMQWFVMQNMVTSGPYSEDDLALKINNGVIQLDARIRRADSKKWVKASSVFVFPRSAYIRQEKLTQYKNSQRNKQHAAAQYSLKLAADQPYLEKKAQHVKVGNVVAGIGMVGSVVGLSLQLSAIGKEDEALFYTGIGVSFGFGIMRFAGAIASGIAATRYARKTEKDFSWVLFTGGWLFGLGGQLFVTLASNNEDVPAGVILGTAVTSQVVLTMAWIAHCIAAAQLTSDHRKSAVVSNGYAILPTYDPIQRSIGLLFHMQY